MKKKIEEEIIEVDGKLYYVRKCPHCGNELLFRKTDEPRRVYGACRKCGKDIEFWFDQKGDALS